MKTPLATVSFFLCTAASLPGSDTSGQQQQGSGVLGLGIAHDVRERINERTERITDNTPILNSTAPLDTDKPQGGLVREAAQVITTPVREITTTVKDGIHDVMPTKAAPFSRSGFLSSYEGFSEDPDTGAWIWRRQEGVLARYSRFIIAPIIVYPANDEDFQGIDPDALQKVTNYFKAELSRELTQAGYTVTDKPGEGTGVLRIAIVDLVAGNPVAYAGSWMPYARVADAASTASGNVPMGAGSISIEAELLNSLSGEREGAVIDTLAGKKLEVRQSLNKWGDISQAIRDWAQRFTSRVTKARS